MPIRVQEGALDHAKLMKPREAKKHIFRVVTANDPSTPFSVLAAAIGVDVRTLRNWRAEQQRAAGQIRLDADHCRRVLERA